MQKDSCHSSLPTDTLQLVVAWEKSKKEKATPFGVNLMKKPSSISGCPGVVA